MGTDEYIAPETLEDKDLSYACDLWSLGIIIYQLLCGETPFKGRSILETYQNIKNNDLTFVKDNIDPVARDLVTRLLIKEPRLRIGAHDIRELKSHEYFKDIDWENLRNSPVPFNAIKRP